MTEIEPQKTTKNPASRRCSDIDLDKVKRKFLNVLSRESKRLLDESHEEMLSDASSKKLCNYLKLIKDLQNQELDFLEKLGPEDDSENPPKTGKSHNEESET